MLRVVLALLAGLPLLMPPGMCFCKFTPCGKALVDDQCGCGDLACSRASAGTCEVSCCSHGVVADRHGAAGDPATMSQPGHGHHEHCSDCPAIFGATPNRIAPSPLVVFAMFDFATGFVEFELITKHRFEILADAPRSRSLPPFFLTHCSLLL